MIGFRAFVEETEGLEEGIVRKGAVTLYALQGKRHGDEAVRHYQAVRQALSLMSKKTTDQKVDALAQAMNSLADGLAATRRQIGSVSAQLTALSL
jgi:hypothetical protein